MAAHKYGVSRVFFSSDFHALKAFLRRKKLMQNSYRSTHLFRHLAEKTEHNETDYEYEISKNPDEWKHVEKLLPLETVPVPQPKAEYYSQWAPMREEALQHPYFVQRTKNHMLPVYFNQIRKRNEYITKLSKIHGDLWSLHDELQVHLESETKEKVLSMVHEANGTIKFKGDFVYFVEKWLLSKGF